MAPRWEEGPAGGRCTHAVQVSAAGPQPPGTRPEGREGETLTRALKTIPSLPSTFWILSLTPPSPGKSPFLLVSNPLASESLTIPRSFPACIFRRTTVATVDVVWKSFFSSAASLHRNKKSWFHKIKFRHREQESCLRHSKN